MEAVLLQYRNKFITVPLAYGTNMKQDYEDMKILLI